MKRNRQPNPNLKDLSAVLGGNFLYGAAVRMFLNPNHVSVGGFAGLASLGEYLWQIPTGTGVLLLNLPLLLFALFRLRGSFFVKTVGATVVQSVALDLLFFLPAFTENKLLAAAAGGVLSGLGLGLILSRGIATGGSDLLAKLIRSRFPRFSYGRLLLLIDGVILSLSAVVYRDPWSILYSAVTLWLSATVIDRVISGPDRAKSICIITQKKREILAKLFDALPRGATAWKGQGGYTGRDRDVILTVVRNYELIPLKRAVKEIDPAAFMIVSDAAEVLGQGFRNGAEL